MKKTLLFSILVLSVLGFSNCKNEDTSTKDNLTQLVLAGGGNSGTGTSCIASGKCLEIDGFTPVGYDFSTDCASIKGSIVTQTCSAQGYTSCVSQTKSITSTIKTCSK
ncbi:MAG: hypothetical protein KDK36_04030 [Leptospiraceae bacterium]|nr:hypothetical protein [Leptospiraceae bacterium]